MDIVVVIPQNFVGKKLDKDPANISSFSPQPFTCFALFLLPRCSHPKAPPKPPAPAFEKPESFRICLALLLHHRLLLPYGGELAWLLAVRFFSKFPPALPQLQLRFCLLNSGS
ncbi:hypothetical protein SLEP1_g45438 [Rubroshorea leprosula]|nr:hypothetical protein SLEP1_g45438 [Rubroshorea leprosula]